MNTNNKIIWEKWKDPFGYDNQQENDELDSYESESEEEGFEKLSNIKKVKCQIISTPLGIIPFNEITPSSDIFNFWTGHANFALIKDIANIIEDTPGVETLNIFTKYRFRIGVGKAFNDSVVMRKINQNVYKYLNECENYVE